MSSLNQAMCHNRLLQVLSAESFARLQPHLEPVKLALSMVLVERDTATADLFFLESGLASIIATAGEDEGERIEVGHIGLEGFSGIHVVLDTDRTPNRTFMQVEGTGLRIPSADFLEILKGDTEADRTFRRYIHTYQIQLAQSALANGRYNMSERLSRWLLMCHDRLEGDDLNITHQFLALMLGVRRAGVTEEIQVLEGLHVIRATRGKVHIRDRAGLEDIAGGCYGVPEREYARLIGSYAKQGS